MSMRETTPDMKNRSFFERAQFALVGLLEGWRRERSFRTQVTIAGLVIVLVAILGASTLWLAVICLTIALVLASELLNSSLEALVDHLHPDIHPEIRIVKDMAAGSVLLVSIGAVLVGLLFIYDHF
jgi:undecaprenol kinase